MTVSVWSGLVKSGRLDEFLSMEFMSWVAMNLIDSRYVLEHSRHLQGLTCKANKLRKLSRALQGQSSNVPKPRTPPPVNPVKVNTDNV
ncbi:hypothetical protein V6N12_041856 [Hibiscus sabdariffa]|uniref:Uncharacterized protein n=1 Tax=Hibiscus sabdariffa TaxID=183260 RepID=A0ABR2EDH5_9ROSI